MSKMATSEDVPRRLSDSFQYFHLWICLLVILLAHISVVTAAANADTKTGEMRVIRELKTSLKDALHVRSGRIRAKEDGLPDTVGTGTHEPNDDPTIDWFEQYDKLLTDREWARFEGLQYQFRLDLATKRHGKNYFFIHPNPIKWWELIKLLTSIFIRGGEFQMQKPDHGEYSTSFLKYVYLFYQNSLFLIWVDNHCQTMLIETGI